jgi:CubicO group peptidase (beta-lactamase class C family)
MKPVRTAALPLLFLAVAVAPACRVRAPDPRIDEVEQGLLPSVLIAGAPSWPLEQRMARYNVPGVSIAVFEDSRIVWSRAYGLLDADFGDPVTPDPLFQAASITKPVAAVVAMRLVQEGRLDLDADVNEYLRSWRVPENEFTRTEKVTARRLLSHQAGLTVGGFRGYAPDVAVPTILQVLDGSPPANSPPIRVDREPGSGYRYSGGGYTVLQLLIEEITGRPLAELADELVFEPLQMTSSTLRKPLPETLSARISAGHTSDGASMPGHRFLKGGSACCGLWTTPSDLARFAIGLQQALRGDSKLLLDADTAREMLVPPGSGDVGLGLFLEAHGDTSYFRHSGGNPGFSCLLVAARDGDYGAAVMTNGDNGSGLIGEIVRAIAAAYDWPGYAVENFASIDALVEARRKVRSERPDAEEVSESRLNQLGYSMINEDRLPEAIRIFALNAEFYPRSANCLDSLADAREAGGDFAGAIAASRRAIELLDSHPERNAGYEKIREIAEQRIWLLEEEPPLPEGKE